MGKRYRVNAINRKRAGYKSRSAGDYFESMLFFFGTRQKIEVVRIPNGCKMAKIQGRLVPIPIKSPFDYIIAKNGVVACLDCKTIESGNFSFSMLTPHQVEGLLNLELQSVKSGYVIYYRDTNRVIFYKASTLNELCPGESLKEQDGILIGDNQVLSLDLILSSD